MKHIQYDVVAGKNPAKYDRFQIYSQSKLANLWFIAALNRKLEASGANVIAVATHPGMSRTDLLKPHKSFYIRFCRLVGGWVSQSAEKGAWPLLMAATDPRIARENYYGPSQLFETSGPAFSNASLNPVVKDEQLSDELWRISEELCEFKYPI